ncbi:hypothetical protein FKW77_003205 [Venturia effusa]|uniref:BTB domain-containing protein n=1 Tax=Venturia effusa TaxID=50376 RepID=A0A517LJX3_9PEZI|nr:hypothetical protein FKW77_003205 [Venturia effusa]
MKSLLAEIEQPMYYLSDLDLLHGRRLTSSSHGKSITVCVGQHDEDGEVENFIVHEELIRAQSPFFEAAMARDWPESKARLVTLDTDSPDVFGLYVNWIYRHRIYLEPLPTTSAGHDVPEVVPNGGGTVSDEVLELFRARHNLLVRAYILGDKILDRDFQDAVIDGLIDFSRRRNVWPIRQVKVIFENTLEKSPLRTLLVHMCSFNKHADRFKDPAFMQYLTAEALFDIAADLMDNRDHRRDEFDAPFWGNNLCRYHIHEKEGRSCYRQRYRRSWGPMS